MSAVQPLLPEIDFAYAQVPDLHDLIDTLRPHGPVVPVKYLGGPDSLPQKDVPKGKLEGPVLFKSQVIKDTIRKYWVHVPAQYTGEKPANVLVFQDGARAKSGRCSARASARENPACVMGSGAVRLNAPCAAGFSSRNTSAATSSAR